MFEKKYQTFSKFKNYGVENEPELLPVLLVLCHRAVWCICGEHLVLRAAILPRNEFPEEEMRTTLTLFFQECAQTGNRL